MKIIFMGTPDFSVPVLQRILEDGHEVALVVTQPDREKGRGKGVAMSPVKEEALRHGLTVFQPDRVRRPENLEELRKYPADVAVVVAFGQLLPQELLDMPRLGCINVHASLLPAYRGASPIQHMVIDGCTEAGVTTMQMDAGLDTGDILLQRSIPVGPEETGGSLWDRLSVLGAELLSETLRQLEQGTLVPVPQTGETSYAGMLTKEMGHLDWSRPALVLERLVRGLNPWPSAYCFRDGKLLKLWRVKALPGETGREPGCVAAVTKQYFDVQTGDGLLRVLNLQPEGKKAMDADAYLRGYPVAEGDRLE